MFTLSEKMLLLSLHKRKSTYAVSNTMDLGFGLVAALLAELIQSKRLALGIDNTLIVVDRRPTGDALRDGLLKQIQAEKRSQSLNQWINGLSLKMPQLQKDLIGRLVTKGALKEEQRRVYGLFPIVEYSVNREAELNLMRQNLRGMVFLNEPVVDGVILLSLLNACLQLDALFTREELKTARKTVEDMTFSEPFGRAIMDLIDEIKTAAMLASMSGAASY